jgi:hypothetical protein
MPQSCESLIGFSLAAVGDRNVCRADSDARWRAGALRRRVSEAKFQPLTRNPATENTRPNALA